MRRRQKVIAEGMGKQRLGIMIDVKVMKTAEIEREYKTSVAHVALGLMAFVIDGNLHIYWHQVGTLLPMFMANYTGLLKKSYITLTLLEDHW